MTDAEHRRLTEIEDLVRRAQMSARLAIALLPPHTAVSGKNLHDVREELVTGVQALRDALAGLEDLRPSLPASAAEEPQDLSQEVVAAE